MRKIDFEAGLFGRLRAGAGDLWEAYVAHEFVARLGRGDLPETCFRKFLVQDYLFLKHFARAYGLAIAKATEVQDIRDVYKGLGGILEEVPLHVAYCKSWGISEAEMQAAPEADETIAYTRFVIDIGISGDLLDLMVALMPCVAGYAEVGMRLLSAPDTDFDKNPYAVWIRNYEGDGYAAFVNESLATFNALGDRFAAANRLSRLQQIFSTATRLEGEFWQMGLNEALTAA